MAGESARFDTRFLKIGLHPGGGNTWRLRRITDLQTTMALVVFGEVVDGRRAAALGLAWSCAPDAELMAQFRVAVTQAPQPGALLEPAWQALVSAMRETTVEAATDDHIYFSKEASSGGRAFGGGGCGCN